LKGKLKNCPPKVGTRGGPAGATANRLPVSLYHPIGLRDKDTAKGRKGCRSKIKKTPRRGSEACKGKRVISKGNSEGGEKGTVNRKRADFAQNKSNKGGKIPTEGEVTMVGGAIQVKEKTVQIKGYLGETPSRHWGGGLE